MLSKPQTAQVLLILSFHIFSVLFLIYKNFVDSCWLCQSVNQTVTFLDTRVTSFFHN